MYEKRYVWYAFPNLLIISTSHQTVSFCYFGRIVPVTLVKNVAIGRLLTF